MLLYNRENIRMYFFSSQVDLKQREKDRKKGIDRKTDRGRYREVCGKVINKERKRKREK